MNINQKPLSSTATFARIGLCARSETRLFLVELARLLKKRYGSTIVLYSGGADKTGFYAKYADAFDEIVDVKTLHAASVEPPLDLGAEIERARIHEATIGYTYNFLAVSNRHLGRGYALGGFYHLRSRYSEETAYVNLLHAYNEVLDFWDREIAQRRLTLVINGPREAEVMCKKHGIPLRGFAGSRYLNYHNWAWNEFYENPEFEIAYRAGEGQELPDLDRPYYSHLVNRSHFMKQGSLFDFCKRAALDVARQIWWKLRGYEKGRGYFLSQRLLQHYRTWADRRLLSRLATTKLDDLKKTRFVFFPLQQEPETALQGLSPEYFFQLSAIASVARDLPAGVLLAVKETFGAIGRRPRDFYRQIAEFKNVVWLEPLELGLECARRADVIVTINGTSGFEGAVLGKPVVTFGHHNNYNVLPHVHVVKDQVGLQSALAQALNRHDPQQASLDGRRYLQATVSRSFDMRSYNFIDVANFDPQSVEDACDALARGLEAVAAVQHATAD